MNTDPLEMFKTRAEELIRDALDRHDIDVELPVEIPPENMGDYAFPCFMLAREMRKSPADIARQLCQEIPEERIFSNIEAMGPYINFTIIFNIHYAFTFWDFFSTK